MASLYAEDALLTPPGAPAQAGRAAIKTFLGEDAATTKAAGLAIKTGTVTGVDVAGDIGWMSGSYTVVDASGAAVDSGSYLSVHRRTNGVWLYTRDIWNSDRLRRRHRPRRRSPRKAGSSCGPRGWPARAIRAPPPEPDRQPPSS